MKRYGLMLADNGSPWYVSGAPDPRWDNDQLHALDRLRGSDFEVVTVRARRADAVYDGQASRPSTCTHTPVPFARRVHGSLPCELVGAYELGDRRPVGRRVEAVEAHAGGAREDDQADRFEHVVVDVAAVLQSRCGRRRRRAGVASGRARRRSRSGPETR